MIKAQNFESLPTKEIAPAIHRSVSFRVPAETTGFSADTLDVDGQFFYSRWANPTTRCLEKELATLEGGEDALAFASGMAAVTGLFFTLLKSGDHLIAPSVCYPGVTEFLHGVLSRYDVEFSLVDMSEPGTVADALKNNTRAIFVETPANPILRLTDIAEIAQIANRAGVQLIVDSTFATPVATKPLSLGADYVVHSLTKYIGGHGDTLGGVVIGAGDAIQRLRQEAMVHLGAVLDSFPAWLILRSLVTLEPRMRSHSENATAVAKYLEEHSRIRKTIYPGLPSHPQFELAQRQMRISSGMIAFQADNPEALARRIADEAEMIAYAVSLGKPTSLIYYIPTKEIDEQCFRFSKSELEKYRMWAGDGMFRFSVGLEDPELVCNELDRLLSD